jgi:hypothetical protein
LLARNQRALQIVGDCLRLSELEYPTTLKTNAYKLKADGGIRLGIYPERRSGELPAWDERRNLILCPLHYSGAFVERLVLSGKK